MSLRLFARLVSCLAVAATASTLAVSSASAQGVDIIIGSVKDSAGRPIKGATVEAYSMETRMTQSRPTDEKGNYTIIINDGGGQYRLTVRAIGMTPQIRNVAIQGDDDRIVQQFKLGAQAVPLADINSNATNALRNDPTGLQQLSAADQARELSATDASRLGISLIDGIAALASLAPGVIMVPGSDTSAMAFQVNGQSIQDNSVLVDGLASAGLIPQDGLGRTRIVTNTFDASRGGFTGGQVTTTTARGTNSLTGSASLNLQDRHLAWGEGASTINASGNTQQVIGLGVGGPLVRNRWTAFGSFSATRGVQPIVSVLTADSLAFVKSRVSADSATRFIAIENGLGLNQHLGTIADIKGTDQGSFSGRTDFIFSGGSVSLTGNMNLRSTDPTTINATSLPMTGGNTGSDGWGSQATLVNRINNLITSVVTNTLRVGYNVANSDQSGYITAPRGQVRNYSDDIPGASGLSLGTFTFGGNSSSPTNNHTKTLSIDNQLSFLTGGGAHRIGIGTTLTGRSTKSDNTSNRYGTYLYQSLADFEANIPSQFTRTLQPTPRNYGSRDAAVFISDNFRHGNLQITFGSRAEKTFYTGAPKLNQDALDKFGIRTNVLPHELAVLPTMGFSYNIPAKEQNGNAQAGFGQSQWSINGGVRLSRSSSDQNLPGTAQANAGFSTNETQLYCVGDQVPANPDWNGFATDPSTIPSVCADGSAPNPITTGLKTLTTYDSDYGPKRTFGYSFGVRRRVANNMNLNLTWRDTYGYHVSATRDLNLKLDTPFFIANEANRPVYVDPSLIVPETGQVPFNYTRKDEDYGSVRQYFNSLHDHNKSIQAQISGTTRKQLQLNFTSTISWGKDEGGGNNLTASSPNVYLWAPSSSERRVNLQASVVWPLPFTNGGLELSLTGSAQSGSHYSPRVGGDINGDGSSNDLAFIFDPAHTADTAVASAMTRVIGGLTGNAKDCVMSQLGTIAKRNSCTGPWSANLTLNANWRPTWFGHRLVVQFNTVNFLQGVDNLVHGDGNLHGWGNAVNPNSTLLTVNGFDPVSKTYKYTVNETFGLTTQAVNVNRQPFQLRINARYSIGVDNTLNRFRQATPGSFGPEFIKNVQTMFPNMARLVLDQKDVVSMSPDQVTTISKVAATGDSLLGAAVAQLEVDQKASGGVLDPLKLAPLFVTLTNQQDAASATVHSTLTDVQWALLPASIRNLKTGVAALPANGANGNNNNGNNGNGGNAGAGAGGRGGRGGG